MWNKFFKKLKIIGLAAAIGCCSCLPVYATDLQNQIDEAREQGAQLEGEKASAEQQLYDLNQRLDDLNVQIANTQTAIEAKYQEIESAEEYLTNAKVVQHKQYESMKKRIKYMYENSHQVLTILLEAGSLSDFMNKAEYVSMLSKYDRDMLTKFDNACKDVAQKEQVLRKEHEALLAMQDDLAAQQREVQACINEQADLIASLEGELGANAELVAGLQAQLDEYNRQQEAARAAAEAARQAQASQGSTSAYNPSGAGSSQVVGSGVFCNPCPAGYLSSDYGYRTFDNSFHKGIDLACGTGNPVYAVDSGTVIIACYSASAGNWVVIDHGNGVVTKYMHNSELYVSAGQTVSRGQNIAAVGSTGNSTGPHCHFQVEVNGSAVNPWNYL